MESQIQDYSIERVIREERIGTVYLAIHVPSNKQVTIRLINSSLIDGEFFQQLVTKYKVLIDLNHPAIGKFYSYARQGDSFYLISEFIPGFNLQEYIAAFQEKLSEEKILDIVSQLIDAFAFAQNQGVSHFMLHPHNIFIMADEQVKVLDFGIAGLFNKHSLELVNEINQLQYMSPEQINGQVPDARSDIYSLGVILFELITGQTAYPSVLSEAVIKNKIISHSLPPIQLYTKAFGHSYTMQGILDKATAKNPAYRFEDFRALQDSLLEVKDEQETMLVSQLMLEVNIRSNRFGSENISTIKLARQKKRKKRIGQTFLALGLMSGAVAFGLKFTTPSADKNLTVLTDQESEQTPTTIDVPEKEHQIAKSDETTKQVHSSAEQQKEAPEKKEATETSRIAASPSKVKKQTSKSAVSHAGFSLEATPEKSFSHTQLQNRLEGFYAALRSKDVSQTNDFYAPVLTKFFNEKNVDEKQLERLLQKAWKRTPQDDHQILWDTFQYHQDEQGNYIVEFYMNYVYHRANRKAWRSRKIYTMIKMDRDLKIYYMSGD